MLKRYSINLGEVFGVFLILALITFAMCNLMLVNDRSELAELGQKQTHFISNATQK